MYGQYTSCVRYVDGVRTMHLGHVETEVIALFKHTLTPSVDKIIEAGSKLSHALAQVIESKVDAR